MDAVKLLYPAVTRLPLCRGGGRHGQGGPSNPDAYVQPNMLEDPWADLMRDFHCRQKARQRQQPGSSSAAPAAAGAASMADVLAAADQVNHKQSQSALWHNVYHTLCFS